LKGVLLIQPGAIRLFVTMLDKSGAVPLPADNLLMDGDCVKMSIIL
jgi:hypothetical protein